MKLRKIMAGVIAAAVAVTAMASTALSTSAAQPFSFPTQIMKDGQAPKTLEHFNNKEYVDFLNFDLDLLLGEGNAKKIETIDVTITYDNVLQVAAIAAFTTNGHWTAKGELTDWANSTGEVKTQTFTVNIGEGWYTDDDYIDTATGEVVPPLLAFQCWGGAKGNISIDGIKFYNAKKKEIKVVGKPELALAAVETTTAVTTTEAPAEVTEAPAAVETAEVSDEMTIEDTAEVTVDASTEEVGDVERVEIDNDAFVFPGQIDIEKAVGDAYADLAYIDVTFTWDAEQGWNGGAGISGITYADGTSAWIGSAEIGTVNANEAAYGGKDTGTFRLYDFTANGIEELVSYDEDGFISGYANLDIQGWWNFVEAGVKVTKVAFLDADENEIAVLDYTEGGAETADVTTDATAEDTTDAAADDKANPSTGAAGVAAIAGIVAIAGAAVVISRKRK